LEELRTWNGQQVAPDLKSKIIREYERLQMVEDQIKALEKVKTERLKNPDTESLEKVVKLASLSDEISDGPFSHRQHSR